MNRGQKTYKIGNGNEYKHKVDFCGNVLHGTIRAMDEKPSVCLNICIFTLQTLLDDIAGEKYAGEIDKILFETLKSIKNFLNKVGEEKTDESQPSSTL